MAKEGLFILCSSFNFVFQPLQIFTIQCPSKYYAIQLNSSNFYKTPKLTCSYLKRCLYINPNSLFSFLLAHLSKRKDDYIFIYHCFKKPISILALRNASRQREIKRLEIFSERFLPLRLMSQQLETYKLDASHAFNCRSMRLRNFLS